jgi:hypothetical protein
MMQNKEEYNRKELPDPEQYFQLRLEENRAEPVCQHIHSQYLTTVLQNPADS